MAVLEEPKYQSVAVILIIKSLFPLDNSGCCNSASPVIVVMRIKTCLESQPVCECLLGAWGSWSPEFSLLSWGVRLTVEKMPG